MRVPATPGQVPDQCHLEEIARRLDAMVVQVQLMAQMRYPVPGLPQGDLARFRPRSDVKLPVRRRPTLGVRRHKLTHRTRRPVGILLELDLRHNNVVLQHRPAVGTDGVPAGIVHLDFGTAAVVTLPAGGHYALKHEKTRAPH